MKTVVITGSTRGLGKLSPGIMITDFLTSAKGKQNQTDLDEKTKNGTRISWLTAPKAAFRFMTSGINKRNFF